MEDVKHQTEIKIEQHQREFYLRQQLRAIQAELGEADPGEKEAIELLKKIEDAKLPEQSRQEARRETERMRSCRRRRANTRSSGPISTGSSRCRGTSGPAKTRSISRRSGTRSTASTTASTRRRSASSSTSPCASYAAAIRMARFCALSDRRGPARRHSARRSAADWA